MATRTSLLLMLMRSYAAGRGQRPDPADLTAAFLNEGPIPWELPRWQPDEGLHGVPPGRILRLLKESVELASVPRAWWQEPSTYKAEDDNKYDVPVGIASRNPDVMAAMGLSTPLRAARH